MFTAKIVHWPFDDHIEVVMNKAWNFALPEDRHKKRLAAYSISRMMGDEVEKAILSAIENSYNENKDASLS